MSRLLAYFKQRPVVAAIIIVALDMALSIVFTLAAMALVPGVQPDFIALCLLTFIVLVALTALGWWRLAGFNPPSAWRNLGLLILPALIIIVPPIVGGIKPIEPGMALYLIVAYTLVGLREEALHRGILLHILEPLGPRRSAWISATLFGLAHLSNIFARSNPLIVVAQAVGAFCDGLGFAALRIRTNTIWFLVVLHALHDLLLQYTRLPAIPLDVAQVTLLLIYGVYILRPEAADTAVVPLL